LGQCGVIGGEKFMWDSGGWKSIFLGVVLQLLLLLAQLLLLELLVVLEVVGRVVTRMGDGEEWDEGRVGTPSGTNPRRQETKTIVTVSTYFI